MGLDHHIIFVDVSEKNIDLVFRVYKWLYRKNKDERKFLDWLHREIISHLKKAKQLSSENIHIYPSVGVWFTHNEPDILGEYIFDLLSTIILFEDYNSVIIFKFDNGDKETLYHFIKGKYFDERGNVYKVNRKKLLQNIVEYKKSVYKEKLKKLERLSKKLKTNKT